MKKILCLALLMALTLAPAVAEAYWVDVALGFWQPAPSGGISYDDGSGTATTLDLGTTMGLDKETVTIVRAKVDLPFLNVALMSTPLSYEGISTLTGNVTFGGTTFPISTPVATKLDMKQIDATLFWAVPFLSTASAGIFNAEFGLNFRMLDVDASVEDTGSALSESKTMSVTIPMLYLAAQIKPTDSIAIEAEYKGLSSGDNEYTDIIARLKWSPIPLLNLSVGHRSQALKLDEEGILSDIEFKGAFAEVGLQF